jgi:hypothetical protein
MSKKQFEQKKQLAKKQDKNFKRHKNGFDDTNGQTGEFPMPVHWLLVLRDSKCLAADYYSVFSRNVELIDARVRFETYEGAVKNRIDVKSYEFVPLKSAKANDYGFDTDTFVLEMGSESSVKKAAEIFIENGLNASFVTADGSALTVYIPDEVAA